MNKKNNPTIARQPNEGDNLKPSGRSWQQMINKMKKKGALIEERRNGKIVFKLKY